MWTFTIALALLVASGATTAERPRYTAGALGNTLTASYDLGGRRTDIRNPNTGHLYRYAYDRVGNVTSLSNDVMMAREDRFGGRVDHRYGYDALDRLVSAEGSWETRNGKREQYTLGFSYSDIHTPLRKTQEHTTRNRGTGRAIVQRRTSYDFAYEYGGSRPHAPSRIGDDDYRYDPNGNTTLVDDRRSGQRRTMVWDEEDRVASISDNGRTTAFVYDHSGIRTAKIGAGGETVYVNPLFTVRNGSVATKHVFIGTDRIASKLSPGRAHVSPRDDDLVSVMLGRWWLHRSASGWEHARNLEMNPHYRVPSALPDGGTPETNFLYFYHSDHLGSTSYVTDSEGELYEHVQYFPTGEVWVQEASNTERLPHLFTSRELDQETGLSYHTARYYNPRTSLWISADPIAPRYLDGAPNAGVFLPLNLQTYCYSWNSPATVSDPDGACPMCATGAAGAGIGAAVGGGGYLLSRLIGGGPVSLRALAGATFGGAVTGGMAGMTGGASLLTQVAGGALAAASGGIVQRTIAHGADSPEANDYGAVVSDAATGAMVTMVGMMLQQAVKILAAERAARAAQAGAAGINIGEQGLGHVLARHFPGGAQAAGKSLFNAGETVPGLVRGAESVAPVLQKGGNFARIVDAGRAIGVDRTTSLPTTIYTVITNQAGNLVTMFPGVP